MRGEEVLVGIGIKQGSMRKNTGMGADLTKITFLGHGSCSSDKWHRQNPTKGNPRKEDAHLKEKKKMRSKD